MNRSISRLLIELSIAAGIFCIVIAVAQKLTNVNQIYDPRFLGLTPKEYLGFGAICLLFSVAIAGRKAVKYIEYRLAHMGIEDRG